MKTRILHVSRSVSLFIASGLMLLDLAVILSGVLMRYFADGAPIWSDELSRFLIIGSVLLAAGAVWVEGGHMRVAIIERLLPTPLCRLLNGYQWLLTLAVTIAAAFFSYRYALSVAMFSTQGLGISRTIPMLALPIGFGLLAWQVLWHGPAALKSQDDTESHS